MKNLLIKSIYIWPLLSAGMLCAQDDAPPQSQGMWHTFIMIGVAFLFFYLILWRPEQKRRRELEHRRSSLCKGDRVTAMGIIGTVSKMQEGSVILKMVDGSKIEVIPAAITDVQGNEGGESESK